MRSLPPLNSLRVFETAGEYLSFTTASRALNVTQGAVSKQIRQLEEYLGVNLFTRKHGRLELTQAGKDLLLVIQQAFSTIEREIAGIRNPNLRERLAILAPPTFCSRWLSPRIKAFTVNHHQYEIQLYSEKNDGVNVDVEICFEQIEHSKNCDLFLFSEKYIGVCNHDLLSNSTKLEEQTHKMLHIRHLGHCLPSWHDWLNAAGIILPNNASPGITMSTQEQVINAAISGNGFAIVDQHMAGISLSRGALVQFNPLSVRSQYGYTIRIPTGKKGLRKVDDFCSWITETALDES
ncbi:LysR family transcriptional regulator [Vibrio metschnikovii]|uniref:LysR family transcriptional regulator n=1 Tax=Vibrio metschnikovii TaxID=28172 RepID=UPI001C30EA01|nr:LysR family transcriptional regulator [Vibrio metschnikovii]